MITKEDIRKLLLEILGQSTAKGRRWFFPKNVDKKYKIFLNMTFKDIVTCIVPAALICIIILAIPPLSSVIFWIIKVILVIIIFSLALLYVNYRPVPSRDNIRTRDFIKEIVEYQKSQKVYFIKPKEKLWESGSND